MDIIEAARQGQGLIILEDDSAEQVKRAIEKVSKITGVDGRQVAFEGYLLHTYMDLGPNWAVAEKTLQQTLAGAPDRRVARRAHGLLVQKNLISSGH